MSKKENFWIPYADLMTVSMIIFLFISVSYMALREQEKHDQDQIFKEYMETKKSLFNELDSTFKNDFKRWDLELDKDLSIKFTNPEILFESGSPLIKPYFRSILYEFLPKYFDIILADKYVDKIAEIRIEGHTDTVPAPQYHIDPYISNLMLSQYRSTQIVYFLRNLPYFNNLPSNKIRRIEYLLTANGLSYGRTLDYNGKLTYSSHKLIDQAKSRRVEFRIITTSESLVQKVIEQLEK